MGIFLAETVGFPQPLYFKLSQIFGYISRACIPCGGNKICFIIAYAAACVPAFEATPRLNPGVTSSPFRHINLGVMPLWQ